MLQIKKKFSFTFTTAKTRFCLNLHDSGDVFYLFVTRKEIYKFRANNKNVKFPTQFGPGSVSEKFAAVESGLVSFHRDVIDFSND